MSDIQRNRNNEKLIEAVKFLKLEFPIKDISSRMSVDKGNLSSFLSNKKSVSKNFLEKFEKEFYTELIGFNYENKEAELNYNKLNEPKESYLANKKKPMLSYGKGRPFYDIDFTLGIKELNNDVSLSPEFNIDFPPANKEGVNWFRGKGNSMLGEINSGDYVALEEVIDFSWFPLGRIYGIVTKNGFRTIKRVVKSHDNDNYCLVSSNPDKEEYPDQDIPKKVIDKLFKVVFVIKDLDE